MKYFVTGGTGFLGGTLIRQLRDSQHEVVALVRQPTGTAALKLSALGCELAQGDVTDAACLRTAMHGADGVFHVAGWYKLGARDDREAVRVNVEGTRQVLEAMRDVGVPRGVCTSTLAVNSDTKGRVVDESYRFRGRHLTIYDRTKWQAHYEVALPLIERGLPLTIVMPGVIYGPGDQSRVRDLFVRYLCGKLAFVPDRTSYCWGHVEDIAAGHIAAMLSGKPGESFMLAGPAHTLVEVLQIAEKITGIPPPRRRIPPWLMRSTATVTRWLGRVISLPDDLHHEVLLSSGGVTYLGSDRKARTELGFDPRPLETGLRETLDHEQKLQSPVAAANS